MRLTQVDKLADTVRKLLARGATPNALHILRQLHPSVVARLLRQLPAYRQTAFQALMESDRSVASQVLSELGPARSGKLLARMPASEIGALLQELDCDDAAALLAELPSELGEDVIRRLRGPEATQIRRLLRHGRRTAGRIMNPDVFSLSEDSTVGDAIVRLQDAAQLEMVFYLYVVDEHRRLLGVLSLRRLLIQKPHVRLSEIMVRDVIRVTTDTDQEEVARVVASYNLLSVPVVDEENRLVGLVTVDDVIDIIEEEATEDMYRLASLSTQERVFTPARSAVKMRTPWLAVNLVTAFLGAYVVSHFEGTIQRFAVLAVFMPVVAGMGGNAAAQTLTVMVRGIALGELRWSNAGKAVLKELLVGMVDGLAIGGIVALTAFFWKAHAALGLVIAIAMVGNLVVAALAGTLVPITLMLLKVDPALASSVFVTTATDVCGFLLFLELGEVILSRFT